MANYSRIEECSLNNGKGIRTSVFFSGCSFGCKGCFNSEIWDFDVGKPFTREVYKTKIKPTITEHIAGISILGGEPLHPNNVREVYNLVLWFRSDFPDKNIWLWSGFKWDQVLYPVVTDDLNLKRDEIIDIRRQTVKMCDVLVDGRFIEEQKDLTLPFRGSRNQRIIDVQQSLKQNKVVLYEC